MDTVIPLNQIREGGKAILKINGKKKRYNSISHASKREKPRDWFEYSTMYGYNEAAYQFLF